MERLLFQGRFHDGDLHVDPLAKPIKKPMPACHFGLEVATRILLGR